MPRKTRPPEDQSIRRMLIAYHEHHGKRMAEAYGRVVDGSGEKVWPPSQESLIALRDPDGCYVDSGELFGAFSLANDDRWKQFTYRAVKARNDGRDWEWYDLAADGSLTWLGSEPK